MSKTEPASSLLPNQMVEGYKAFLQGRFLNEQRRYRELAEVGQTPSILLIGCCDSRVAPEVIFDARPGELFVVRNVANLVPPYAPDDDYHGTSAAIEYAVMALRVSHVVVVGHAQCGGIAAFAQSEADPYARPLTPGDFIGGWIKLIAPAAERLGPPAGEITDSYLESLAFESVKQSLINLRTFPSIKTLEERGLLALHGAYFGVADGRLLALDEKRGSFGEVAQDTHAAVLAEPRF